MIFDPRSISPQLKKYIHCIHYENKNMRSKIPVQGPGKKKIFFLFACVSFIRHSRAFFSIVKNLWCWKCILSKCRRSALSCSHIPAQLLLHG